MLDFELFWTEREWRELVMKLSRSLCLCVCLLFLKTAAYSDRLPLECGVCKGVGKWEAVIGVC
jgi:hypothetical protein